MCGGGGLLKTVAEAALPVAAAYLGPEVLGAGGLLGAEGLSTGLSAGLGGALGGAASGALGGDGLTGILEGAGLGGLGGYLGPGGGLSDISNSLGLSDFSPGSGLSQLFGGTPAPSGDFTNAFNSISGAAPNLEATAGATAPVDFAPGGASASYLPAGSTGALAGGASGSGFDLGSAGELSALPSASGAGAGLSGAGEDLFNAANSAFPSTGNITNFTVPSASTLGGSSVAPSGGLSSLFGGSNSGSQLVNGLLRSGITGLFNNPNNKGYDAQINAGNQIAGAYNPFLQEGTAANNQLSALYGLGGNEAQAAAQANWQNTPGYQFALDQGLKAVNADAAAKGQLLSGNNQQAIQQYGTGLANQTYNNYLQNLIQQQQSGINAAGGVATGLAGAANAQAGKGGAAANNQNATFGGIANSLFPQPGISFGANGLNFNNGNNGLLSLFQ